MTWVNVRGLCPKHRSGGSSVVVMLPYAFSQSCQVNNAHTVDVVDSFCDLSRTDTRK